MRADKAVVLCSGGLNSAVVTSIARLEHDVTLLHVRWGHRCQSKELDLFERFADSVGITQRVVIDLPYFPEVGTSARVNKRRQLEDALAMSAGQNSSYMPGLIAALLAAGFTQASAIQATKVYIGVSENLGPPAPPTSRLFPDYSREYLQLFNHLYLSATPERAISIETPVIDLTRADIVRLGNRLATPFELTWSCMAGTAEPCGRCLGCATRNRGFVDAAVPDPLLRRPAMAIQN